MSGRQLRNKSGTQRLSELQTQHMDRIKPLGMDVSSYWEKSTGKEGPGQALKRASLRGQVEDTTRD